MYFYNFILFLLIETILKYMIYLYSSSLNDTICIFLNYKKKLNLKYVSNFNLMYYNI